MCMIQFEHISKVYQGDTIALDDITLTIETGEFVSIVGHSGRGSVRNDEGRV